MLNIFERWFDRGRSDDPWADDVVSRLMEYYMPFGKYSAFMVPYVHAILIAVGRASTEIDIQVYGSTGAWELLPESHGTFWSNFNEVRTN